MISKRRCTWWLALLLAVPLVAGGAVAAQSQGEEGGPRGQMGPGGRRGPVSPDDRLKHMTKDFKLTTDQQTKIKPILEAEQKKMQDLMNDASGDRESMRAKMQEIQKDASKQVRDLLDDKQKDQFDKQEQEHQQRMRDRRGGPGGPGGPPQPPQN
jgi:Spy/CpxP family protein refolding chaperone